MIFRRLSRNHRRGRRFRHRGHRLLETEALRRRAVLTERTLRNVSTPPQRDLYSPPILRWMYGRRCKEQQVVTGSERGDFNRVGRRRSFSSFSAPFASHQEISGRHARARKSEPVHGLKDLSLCSGACRGHPIYSLSLSLWKRVAST